MKSKSFVELCDEFSSLTSKIVKPCSHPFRHFIIEDFLTESDHIIIESIMQKQGFVERSSDLFHFRQSNELKSCSNQVFEILKDNYFNSDWILFLSNVAKRQIGDSFDTSFQQYYEGDYLLTHDDLLEGRAFAYVLYFVDDNWSSDSGNLCLLNTDDRNCPRSISSEISPRKNLLALFEVSNVSFHFVDEVLPSKNPRRSLTGWFYFKNSQNVDFTVNFKDGTDSDIFDRLLSIVHNTSMSQTIYRDGIHAQRNVPQSIDDKRKSIDSVVNSGIKHLEIYEFGEAHYIRKLSNLPGDIYIILVADGNCSRFSVDANVFSDAQKVKIVPRERAANICILPSTCHSRIHIFSVYLT